MHVFRRFGAAGLATLFAALSAATASAADGPSLAGAGSYANQIGICPEEIPALHFTVAAQGNADRTGDGHLSLQLPDIGTCTPVTITADVTCVIARDGEVLAWGPVRQIISPRSDPFIQANFISIRGISGSAGQSVSPLLTFFGGGVAPECGDPFFDELFQFAVFPVVRGNLVIRPG